MTVMVAEKAGQTAAKKAGTKVAKGKVTSSTYDTYNTRTRARPRPAQPEAAPKPATSQRVRQAGSDAATARAAAGYRRQAEHVGRNIAIPGNRAYQPVLLAEFLAAVVIVVVVPVASGGSDTAKAKGGISPYDTGDLRQLVAVGGVYFVLALASSGNSGRLSAWLGGLILIAIAMSKLAHGNLSAVFNAVTPDQGAGKKAAGIADTPVQ